MKLLTIVLLLLSPCSFASTTDDCFAAIYSLNEGRLDEAIKLYSQCIESGSLSKKNLIAAHNDRGNAYGRKGEYEFAIADFNKVIGLNPEDSDAYYNRGLTYKKQQNYDRAIQDYSRAYENLAWLRATCPEEQYRDGELAIALAKKAKFLREGDDIGLWEVLAAAYARAGEYDHARKYTELSIENTRGKRSIVELQQRLKLYEAGKQYADKVSNKFLI